MPSSQQALGLLSSGLCVIPLKPRSKIAARPWSRYHHERPAESDLKQWFQRGENIAVVCGASSDRLIVLDIDDEEWVAWTLRHKTQIGRAHV